MSDSLQQTPNERSYLLDKEAIRTVRLHNAESSSELHYSMASLPDSTFDTLTEELGSQQSSRQSPHSLENRGRRTLYGALPFMAAFGMQKRESAMKKVVSSASLHTLANMYQAEERKENVMSALDPDEISITVHLILAVVIAVVSQFLVGYNTSVMNAPALVIFPGHSMFSWSLAVSAFAIGGPLGSTVGGYLANVRGRRGTMLINSWIFILGGLFMAFSPNIYTLILGRLITGFASGVAMVVVPVYLGEIAPPTLRGTLGTCTQFAIVVGILASNLLAFPFANADYWRGLFFVTPILATIQLAAAPGMVESPRWLLNKNDRSQEARLAIQKLRAFRHVEEIEMEVQNYLFAAAKHKTSRSSAHSTGAMWDLLTAKDVRILLGSSIVLQLSQQLSGINAVFYYSTMFFEGVLSNPLLGTTLIGVVNLLATILALSLMDNTPRRLLLLCSAAGMLVSMVFITLALIHWLPSWFALLALLVFVTSFAIGLGPIPWLIVAEMFDAKYVATAMSLTCVINWLCNFLVGLSFPYFNAHLREWCFAPFCVALGLTTWFTYVYLPETQGRSVAEVYKLVSAGRRRRNTAEDCEQKQDRAVIDAVELFAAGNVDSSLYVI